MPPGARRFINNELANVPQQGVNFGVQEVAEVVADMLGPNIGARGPKGPRGPQGPQGVQGRTGAKGEKGDSPTAEEIAKELSKKPGIIDPKAIKGLDEVVRKAIPRTGSFSAGMKGGQTASAIRILDTGSITKEGASQINFIGATVAATDNGVDITVAGGTDTNLGNTNLTSTGARQYDMSGNTLNFINNSGFSITNGGNNHTFTAAQHTITSAGTNANVFVEFDDGTDVTGIGAWAGTPEGNVTASQGAIVLDSSGGAPWYKATGDNTNTGWTQLGSGGGGNTIYSADDSLAGARNITMSGNTLTFTSTNSTTQIDGVDGHVYVSGTARFGTNATNYIEYTTTKTSFNNGSAEYFNATPPQPFAGSSISLYEGTVGGTNKVVLQAAPFMAADVTYVLPDADGTNGQVLSTDGSGTLSWATAGGGGNTIYSADDTVAANRVVTVSNGNTLDFNALGTGAIAIQSAGNDMLKIDNTNIEFNSAFQNRDILMSSSLAAFEFKLDGGTGRFGFGNPTITSTGAKVTIKSETAGRSALRYEVASNPNLNEYETAADNFGDYWNTGTPEGVIAADIGSLARDVTNGALYIKTTDTVNTGWSQLGTGGGGNTIYSADDTLTGNRTVTLGAATFLDFASSGGEVRITNTSGGKALDISTGVTSDNGVQITADSLTTGEALVVQSSSASANGNLVQIGNSGTNSLIPLNVSQASNVTALFLNGAGCTTNAILTMINQSNDSISIHSRALDPGAGAVTGDAGSIFMRSGDGLGQLWVKTLDTASTGWTPVLQQKGNTGGAVIPAYDDDTAAGVGGLTAGDIYQTTGSGAAPLNAAGILMVKQ